MFVRMFKVLILCGVAMSSTAFAADVAMVHAKAITGGVAPETLDELTRLVAIEMRERGVPVRVLAAGDPGWRERYEGQRYGLETLLQYGKRALMQRRFGESIAHYQRVIETLWNTPMLLERVDLLREAYVHVAMAYYQQGKEDEARNALAQVVRLEPDIEALDVGNEVGMDRLYTKVRGNALRTMPGVVRLSSDLPRTEAFLNDRPLGVLPVKLEGVLPGRHVLRLQAGELSFVRVIQVPSQATLEIAHAWAHGATEIAAVAARDNRLTPTHRAQLMEHAVRTGALKHLIVLGIGRDDTGMSIGGWVGATQGDEWRAIKTLDLPLSETPMTQIARKVAIEIHQTLQGTEPGARGTVRWVAGWPSQTSEDAAPVEERVIAWSLPVQIKPTPDVVSARMEEATTAVPVKVLLGEQEKPVDLDHRAHVTAGRKPFWKTWWFWTAVGAVAAGAGAGTYLLLQDQQSDSVALETSWGR